MNYKDIVIKWFVKIFDRRKRFDSFNFNVLGIDKIVLYGRIMVILN